MGVIAVADMLSVAQLRKEGQEMRSGSIPHLTIGSNHSHNENLKDIGIVEEFIHEDAEKLRASFKSAYERVCDDIKRPRVLIAGNTGAGKSSIINSVFGSELAKEGAGRPITQHFTKYSPENKPVILYDSKGLEAGMQFEEFLNSTLDFFENNEEDIGNVHLPKAYREDATGLEKRVHLVWYVVNAAGARFQDFEERICRELFGRLPIIFILNKCDISTPEQLESLRVILEGLKLPNCVGIVQAVTVKFNKPLPPVACGNCKNVEDLVIINRSKIGICEACCQQTPFASPFGLDPVLQLTFDTLPAIAKEAFVAAQRVSFQLKEQRARKIITEFCDEQKHTFTVQGLLQIIAKMLTRLSLAWEFRDHGHLYASHIAKDMMSSLSLRDKLFLFVHKNKHQKFRTTAIGIIWNRSVRELAKIVLVEAAESISEMAIEENWHLILEECFRDLNDSELDLLEERLSKNGLDEVLNQEFANFQKKPSSNASSLRILLNSNNSRSYSVPTTFSTSQWEGLLSEGNSPFVSGDTSPVLSADVSPCPERKLELLESSKEDLSKSKDKKRKKPKRKKSGKNKRSINPKHK